MKKIDYRSDTVTKPTAAMREAMAGAPVGDDVYGEDPTINALQAEAAEMLGFEAALFAASGTQTNLIGLMSQCQRGDEAVVGQQWHTYRFEGGGLAVVGSIHSQVIENQPDGTLALDSIRAAVKPDDPHFARTRLIALENTTAGKVLPMDYLTEVSGFARSAGLRMHLDGARLFNAATALATRELNANEQAGGKEIGADRGIRANHAAIVRQAREICRHFDTVSVCLSKGLGAPVGSLLLGSRITIDRAQRVRKMLGGGMRQAGILAAAGRYALANNLVRLADDHINAQRLASGLIRIARQPGRLQGRLTIHVPQTNIFFVDLAPEIAAPFEQVLTDLGVAVTGSRYMGGQRQRWVTHLDVDASDIESTLIRIADWSTAAEP